uniref:Uncharacterized protein n=1 Tax=Neobodo designis TaxID=312471 RepID=A0A7S1MCD2_NEODS|mmetsp:Transcript_37995/g.117398  ORF Transcript_37995/g.117398 Transcript_37995/m.117398 type:complete len:178 (+) Transcript_37995:114-647(+)
MASPVPFGTPGSAPSTRSQSTAPVVAVTLNAAAVSAVAPQTAGASPLRHGAVPAPVTNNVLRDEKDAAQRGRDDTKAEGHRGNSRLVEELTHFLRSLNDFQGVDDLSCYFKPNGQLVVNFSHPLQMPNSFHVARRLLAKRYRVSAVIRQVNWRAAVPRGPQSQRTGTEVTRSLFSHF